MTDIVIKPAVSSDVDRLYEIECACFTTPWSRESLRSFIANTEHTFCITACSCRGPASTQAEARADAPSDGCMETQAEALPDTGRASDDASEIIGYAGVLYVLDEGEISNIAVHPLNMGKGVGFALMRAVQEHCRRAGVKTLHLEVRSGNERAIALYQKCGFVRTGLRRGYYGDNGEDALLYSWKDV